MHEQALINAVKNHEVKEVRRLLSKAQAGPKPLLANTVIDSDTQDTVLIYAVSMNYLDIIEVLLENGAKVSQRNKRGWAPIHIAIDKNHINAMKLLIKHKAKLSSVQLKFKDKLGFLETFNGTPLHFACFLGREKAIDCLLTETDVDVKEYNEDGAFKKRPLDIASQHGHLAVVDRLIEALLPDFPDWLSVIYALNNKHEAVIDRLIKAGALEKVSPNELTYLLCEAIKEGCLGLIKQVIAAGVEVNKPDEEGRSPLHIACEKGYVKQSSRYSDSEDTENVKIAAISLLIRAKANVNARDKRNRTPLHSACISENIPAMDILIKAKAEIDAFDEDGMTALHIASENLSVEAIRQLIKAKATVDIRNKSNSTPLHLASRGRDKKAIECIKHLMEPLKGKKINDYVNLHNQWGRTALHFACERCFPEVVSYLIKAGAEVNRADENGKTALHFACEEDSLEVVAYLIRADAEVNREDKNGKTALHFACEKGFSEVVDYLIKAGAEVNRADENGKTALHYAVFTGDEALIKRLLEAGVDTKVMDNEGNTPLVIARQFNIKIAQLLEVTPVPKKNSAASASTSNSYARNQIQAQKSSPAFVIQTSEVEKKVTRNVHAASDSKANASASSNPSPNKIARIDPKGIKRIIEEEEEILDGSWQEENKKTPKRFRTKGMEKKAGGALDSVMKKAEQDELRKFKLIDSDSEESLPDEETISQSPLLKTFEKAGGALKKFKVIDSESEDDIIAAEEARYLNAGIEKANSSEEKIALYTNSQEITFCPTASPEEIDFTKVNLNKIMPISNHQETLINSSSFFNKKSTAPVPDSQLTTETIVTNTSDIGQWGENYTFHFLKHHYSKKYNITKSEETDTGWTLEGKDKNKKSIVIEIMWLNKNHESYQPIDILIKKTHGKMIKERFIEVKTTTSDEQHIAIFSQNEIRTMKSCGSRYSIFSVTNAGKKEAGIAKIKNPWEHIIKGALPIDEMRVKVK